MNTVQTGNYGENLACEYLSENGYTILKRNYRAANGEIDIIAKIGGKLCFVEVNYQKQQKIIHTARAFIAQFGDYEEISFDVCEVYTESRKINYISNAFC